MWSFLSADEIQFFINLILNLSQASNLLESSWTSHLPFGSLVSWNLCFFLSWVFYPLVLMQHFLKELPGKSCMRANVVRTWMSGSALFILPSYLRESLGTVLLFRLPSASVIVEAFICDSVFFAGWNIFCEIQNTQCSDVLLSLFLSNVLPILWAPFFNAEHFSWFIALISSHSLSLSGIKLLAFWIDTLIFLGFPFSFWKTFSTLSSSPSVEFFSFYFEELFLVLPVPILYSPVFVPWI